MSADIERARELFHTGGYTCVLCKGETVYTSRERGVKPLLAWRADGIDLCGFAAADKVVGNATAFLYALIGVRMVYAPVMSRAASDTLARYGIEAVWDTMVDAIRNRTDTGFCPMELAVRDAHTPQEAFIAIQQKLRDMQSHQ